MNSVKTFEIGVGPYSIQSCLGFRPALSAKSRRERRNKQNRIVGWTCRGKLPTTYLIQAALRSNLCGLSPLRAECRLRGL